MAKNQPATLDMKEMELLRTQLKPEELFVLEYIRSFNRESNKQWQDDGYWDEFLSE